MNRVNQILAELTRLKRARASELARSLDVSEPTVLRLLHDAGAQVCRTGRGRSTRYARTRELTGLGTRLPVYRVRETGEVEPLRELHLLDQGHHWLEDSEGRGQWFEGLPPFAADMSPQGYIGRTFSVRHADLRLPPRTVDWNDDHRLVALARRGEDCVGNLIVGEESLNRWLASNLEPVPQTAYPELARLSAQGQPGSSAAGEQPKFLAYSEGRHVLVKFAGGDGTADRRWRDLLVCEALALEQVRAAGLEAATARWLDVGDFRFLEVERFDRQGERGRRGVLSLWALDAEYFGGTSWTSLAPRLVESGRLDEAEARRVRWLDVFGQLTGNTDRHLGNLSFFFEPDSSQLRLAPAYDMLPMVFAPSGTLVVERAFTPAPPTADTLDVWPDAARHARAYWARLVDCDALSAGFRALCRQCLQDVEALMRRLAPQEG